MSLMSQKRKRKISGISDISEFCGQPFAVGKICEIRGKKPEIRGKNPVDINPKNQYKINLLLLPETPVFMYLRPNLNFT